MRAADFRWKHYGDAPSGAAGEKREKARAIRGTGSQPHCPPAGGTRGYEAHQSKKEEAVSALLLYCIESTFFVRLAGIPVDRNSRTTIMDDRIEAYSNRSMKKEQLEAGVWPGALHQEAMAWQETASAQNFAMSRTPAASDRPGTAPRFSGRQVLVAEDNPVNQQVAMRMLEKLGCEVSVACNGLEAVAMCGARSYDLVLMDCQMPELDGYEATSRIRATEMPERRMPIVALTAYASPLEQEKCVDCGMDAVLSKPIRLSVLEEVLGRWLQHPALPAEPHEGSDELEEVRTVFAQDFGELAEFYLEHSRERIASLHQAAGAGDAAALARIAHAFGGSCASMGATALCRLCKDLEIAAKTGAVPDSDVRLARIETEYGRISGKLQRMLASAN